MSQDIDQLWWATSPNTDAKREREGDSRPATCSLCEGMGELDGFGGAGRTDCHKCNGTGIENN